jgi:peptide deformylase
MALLPIIEFPDSRLRVKAKPVTEFDAALAKLAQDMLDTMYDAPGVGLAAIQVGQAIRMLVLDAQFTVEEGPDGALLRLNEKPQIFINPVILSKDGKIESDEGCLSVPGVTESVQRSEHIVVRFQNLRGEQQELEARGFLAVIIQHEMDHLDGVLIIDRFTQQSRLKLRRQLRELERDGD